MNEILGREFKGYSEVRKIAQRSFNESKILKIRVQSLEKPKREVRENRLIAMLK